MSPAPPQSTGSARNTPSPARNERPVRNKLWQRFALLSLTRIARYVQRIPRSRALRFGERFGDFAFTLCRLIIRRPYDYAHRNLRLTGMPHPGATFAEREAFLRRVFQHFGKGLVEFLRVPAVTHAEKESYTALTGYEHFQEALTSGKGVVIVTGHLGNWEHIASFAGKLGVPLTVVARETEEEGFAAWIKESRENAGYRVLHRGASLREILKILKRGEAIGILPDQNADDVFAPFFGIPAGTTTGPATLALYTGATIIYGHCVFDPGDNYHVRIYPPVEAVSTGNRVEDVSRITTRINQLLENDIRQYPEQWLWVHNRWKNAFEEGYRKRAWGGDIPEDILRRWNQED